MNSKALALGLIVVIAVILALLLGTRGQYPGETPPSPPETTAVETRETPLQQTGEARELRIDAVDYEFAPQSIPVKPGETLRITVVNTGRAFHTFTIDELGIDLSLSPGDEKMVEITIPAGVDSITFYCRPHVGIGMKGEFIVEA